jgi:polyhydroxyalkanoate synthesis regulator phasin
MMSVLKKTVLTTIGALYLTYEKLRDVLFSLIEKGEMGREEAKNLLAELKARSEEISSKVRDTIKAEVRKALDQADIPSKADLKRLETKIDRLVKQKERKAKKETKETSKETA